METGNRLTAARGTGEVGEARGTGGEKGKGLVKEHV